MQPFSQGNGLVFFREKDFGSSDFLKNARVSFTESLGVHMLNSDILKVQRRQNRFAQHGTDANHRCIHFIQPKCFQGLTVRGVCNHCLADLIFDFRNTVGYFINDQNLMAFFVKMDSQIMSEISNSYDNKLFHLIPHPLIISSSA